MQSVLLLLPTQPKSANISGRRLKPQRLINLPTSGPLYVNALIKQDFYLAITLLMFLAILLIVGNLLADLLLVWVDPRVRLE